MKPNIRRSVIVACGILFLGGLFLFVLPTFFPSSTVHAATYYVDGNDGSDSNAGSESAPWKTIQKAADTMVAGDTVNVRGEITYSDTSCANGVVCPANSGSSGSEITYQAWPGTGIPVVDATGLSGGFYILVNDYIIISGFEVKNANNYGVYILMADEITIKNNIIHDQSKGFYTTASNDFYIYNNVMYNNTQGINVGGTSSNPVVKNNIIAGSQLGLLSDDGSVVIDHDYNLYWNNTGIPGYPDWGSDYLEVNNITAAAHDVHADPQFLDVGNNNFRLKAGSPAIDAGTTLGNVSSDILGVSRFQGASFDIGAYETYDFAADILSHDYKNSDTTPSLVFTKPDSLLTKGIATYTVTLDHDKKQTFSVSGIPSFNTGELYSVWKDDKQEERSGTIGVPTKPEAISHGNKTPVKVEFFNEHDGNTTNDEVSVTFKDLASYPLTQGLHTWRVRAVDTNGNYSDSNFNFSIDQIPPSIESLTIADVAILPSDPQGRTYFLWNSTPSFSGIAYDIYKGSTVTNEDNSVDTFEEVSSGPDTITLDIKKTTGYIFNDPETNQCTTDSIPYTTKEYSFANKDEIGNPEGLAAIKDQEIKDPWGVITEKRKKAPFYITTPDTLSDGTYQVNLTLNDKAGNSYTYPTFYLSINSGGAPTCQE